METEAQYYNRLAAEDSRAARVEAAIARKIARASGEELSEAADCDLIDRLMIAIRSDEISNIARVSEQIRQRWLTAFEAPAIKAMQAEGRAQAELAVYEAGL